jgi:two-component system sensor histidine kinase KdpD
MASRKPRALANIIDNAVRWSPPRGRVRVEAGAFPGSVDVRVVDQGPGIPPDLREQVFLPFQRRGDTNNDIGVGLGLAIARGFLDAMNGTLEIEDTAGGGTTVVIRLRPAVTDGNGGEEEPDRSNVG